VPTVFERSPVVADLADRLLDQRIVLVSGSLDAATATDASARLMLLDGRGDDPIEFVLSCPDGDLVAATALADTVELVAVEVRALCLGSIGGPAVLPFALATRRLAQPHATLRLANPSHEVQGRASEIAGEAAAHTELVAELHRRLADATGQGFDQVVTDCDRGRVLTARQAKAYGLVDEIVQRRGLRTI
jgi:ATP-dependent Clp protease protease subunit